MFFFLFIAKESFWEKGDKLEGRASFCLLVCYWGNCLVLFMHCSLMRKEILKYQCGCAKLFSMPFLNIHMMKVRFVSV